MLQLSRLVYISARNRFLTLALRYQDSVVIKYAFNQGDADGKYCCHFECGCSCLNLTILKSDLKDKSSVVEKVWNNAITAPPPSNFKIQT